MERIKVEKAEDLSVFFRAFTTEPLGEDQLDTFYFEDTMSIRMGDDYDSPLKDLFEKCTQPTGSNAHLLLGHRGCGKSTELNKLKQRFEGAEHPVCIVDAMLETDLNKVGNWDIMLLITRISS